MPVAIVFLALILMFTPPLAAADLAPATAEPCADLPAFCRWEVLRIEEACAAGLDAAESPKEAAQALRQRNGDLRQVLEKTYVAVVAWLLARGDLAKVLEEDQAEFIRMIDKLPTEDAKDLNLIAGKIRDRLRIFGTVTGDGFVPAGPEE